MASPKKSSRNGFAYSKKKSRFVAKAIKILVSARSVGIADEGGKLKRKPLLSPLEFDVAMFLLNAFLRKNRSFKRGVLYHKWATLSLLFANYSNYLSEKELKHGHFPEDKAIRKAVNKMEKIGLVNVVREPRMIDGQMKGQDIRITFNNDIKISDLDFKGV